jgi:hypothetical protein
MTMYSGLTQKTGSKINVLGFCLYFNQHVETGLLSGASGFGRWFFDSFIHRFGGYAGSR